jgi:putative PIN family toxin of toxin-antitoxin system
LRAVLDPNVIISALLSSRGAPAAALAAWRDGAFELVVSPGLLDELERALAYPKLRARVSAEEATEVRAWLERSAVVLDDPLGVELPPARRSRDSGDDYLMVLAAQAEAMLVTGDADLLELGQELPIHTPRSFVALLHV